MRVGTYSLGILLALGASTVGFAACGSSVTEVTGGTTGTSPTGTGGAQTTTVTVTASSTATTGTTSTSTGPGSTTASSSSSGGGDQACNDACAHIQMCTGFTCSQAMIDCTTMGMQYDCEFNCAAQTPCAQLGPGTIQKCQAQCANDGGPPPLDGGPPPNDGGMMGATCNACAVQKCGMQAFACGTNQTCMAWLGCLNTCNMAMPQDPACAFTCDTMYPSAKALYDPLYACTCTSCTTECAAGDPCSHVGDGG